MRFSMQLARPAMWLAAARHVVGSSTDQVAGGVGHVVGNSGHVWGEAVGLGGICRL